MGGRFFLFIVVVILIVGAKNLSASSLITIESQKARLTLILLTKLIKLEKNLKNKNRIKILVFLPQNQSAFQDQNIVNEAVKNFLRENKHIFEPIYVSSVNKAKEIIQEKHIDVVYIAGLDKSIKDLIDLANKKGILTISHIIELVPKGVAISLDLERRKACILANAKTWKELKLKFPPQVLSKITFTFEYDGL
ncbi:hypothetical protein Thein_1379 [Thermodesulfatator indicus DSM 15286]|uniref:Uncharacterized protein n=1 Tax=Thermodesulfatator indicus (strain DSM 15286 / JCM 11887 / CIR29812) TaxID=667014 RepID=F8A982_THEID|nr:YfiR/HmsC family protein [Thermodesulfatator indicus]AEH45245.1 hypothetical protein Thein_1379 [Thermodesulfatator indicus DSM 15286]